MNKTPQYIKNLLLPNPQAQRERRVWSIPLESVWIPLFLATNLMGDTSIPYDALGCPIRLGYDKDGSVKFTKTGRPVTKVVKPISDSVALVRQNFVANLQQYSEEVATSNKDAYAKLFEKCRLAGKPIGIHDTAELDKAVKLQVEEALRQAQEQAQEEAQEEATPPDPAKVLATVS